MESVITMDNYEQERQKLVEANANLVGVVLREKEQKVSEHLERLKREYKVTCSGQIPYHMPVLTDRVLTGSRLYDFCRRMPKGADLHVHDMALLPVRELTEVLMHRPEMVIHTKRFDLRILSAGEPLPEGYLPFGEAVKAGTLTPESLLQNWTVAGAADSGMSIWDYFEELFCRHGVLSDNPDFAADYYEHAFRYYCRCGIQHVEIHIMLTESMELSQRYVSVVRQAYYNVKKEYPAFTVRMIGAGVKADNENIELTKRCFLNASYVQETIRDESDPAHPENFLIGFDLVNEEDSSLPLKSFAPMLLKVRKQYPDMKLYIHGGESLATGNENLIDAYLLGASRVGHGLNLYRFPDLHARYVKAEICLEVCPVSNQVLGYATDIRNHPATEYLRTGMAMALCSDDPAYMENETLTDDFFAAIAGWDLTLADVKQFAVNSLLYSGLEGEAKTAALKAYNAAWNAFVEEMLAEMKEEDK